LSATKLSIDGRLSRKSSSVSMAGKNDIDRQKLISHQVIEFRLLEQAFAINDGAGNVALWPPRQWEILKR
jgi:hypothetical protein